MKRIHPLMIVISILFAMSCTEETTIDYAIISGKIENPRSKNIVIKRADYSKEISLEADGSFKDTLNLLNFGIYNLIHGREMTSIYLKNGLDLKFIIDTNGFDESLNYTGKGELENNYLASKILLNQKMTGNGAEIYSLNEQDFLSQTESLNNGHLKKLEALKDADKNFVLIEKTNLVYEKYSRLNSYENNHKYYTKTPEFEISDGFLPHELVNMTFDNEKDYNNSDAYKQLAMGKTLDKLFESIGDDYLNASVNDLSALNEVKIKPLKDDLISYLGDFMVSPGNPNMAELHAFFISYTDDIDLKRQIDLKYNRVKNLSMGNPSPEFYQYENHKGGTTSLADLKGKYVYVDVWATWCGPCIREIPSLKEVSKQFHGKNIEFVSTSIDVAEKHDTWMAMVRDKDLSGIQLMADNDWNSKFVKDYAIEGIPRFILIDPEGNIVSADAPRPSNPKLVELLNSVL